LELPPASVVRTGADAVDVPEVEAVDAVAQDAGDAEGTAVTVEVDASLAADRT